MHSIEAMAEHKDETNERLEGPSIKEDITKEGVWSKNNELGNPKKAWKWLDWGCNSSERSLAFPASKVWAHVASFGS